MHHLFITSLERAGIRPTVAQKLAQHSDIRLTLGVYTHSELGDQLAAIAALPGPPEVDSAGEGNCGLLADGLELGNLRNRQISECTIAQTKNWYKTYSYANTVGPD